VLVSLHNPEFPRFFFYHEHFERFLTKVHWRYQPLWYFIPVLLGCMFPWSLFIPSVGRQVRLELRSPHRNKHLFLLLWAGIIFVFFSVSDSKLIPYILPVFPPVALLLGRMFCTAFENENYNLRLASTVAGFLIILAGVGISLYPVVASKPKLGPLATGLVGGVLVAGGVAALVLRKSEGIRATIAVYAATALIVLTAAPYFVFGRLADNKTTPEFAPIIMKDFGKRDKIACYRFYQQAMPFLTGKRVILVDYKGELEFGSEQADSSSWFIDETRFSRLWNSPPRMFVVVKEHDLDRLRAGVGTAVRVLAKKGEIYLVSNR
jgi:4-amino-4-deoxy-L-arabinose transferase-like glycosyltransferase